jgi:hypothetical protein
VPLASPVSAVLGSVDRARNSRAPREPARVASPERQPP